MAALIKIGFRTYRHIVYEFADQRSEDWFLLSSPLYPLSILAFYLYVVKVAGPRFMKDRPAYNLNTVISIYNITQIIISADIFIRAVSILKTSSTICKAVDYSDSPEAIAILAGYWEYTMVKIVDLLDTIFFVFRKKDNQVTFLHIYHHVLMVVGAWIGTRYYAGSHAIFVGFLNSFVHVIMYSYYFVTNVWPQYKKNIWWKKYVTQLQMAQFVVVVLHALPTLLVKDCQYAAFIGALIVIQNTFFLCCFMISTRENYGKKKNA